VKWTLWKKKWKRNEEMKGRREKSNKSQKKKVKYQTLEEVTVG
jgi:hypothetical protein